MNSNFVGFDVDGAVCIRGINYIFFVFIVFYEHFFFSYVHGNNNQHFCFEWRKQERLQVNYYNLVKE